MHDLVDDEDDEEMNVDDMDEFDSEYHPERLNQTNMKQNRIAQLDKLNSARGSARK